MLRDELLLLGIENIFHKTIYKVNFCLSGEVYLGVLFVYLEFPISILHQKMSSMPELTGIV